jgi:hypothetical protein
MKSALQVLERTLAKVELGLRAFVLLGCGLLGLLITIGMASCFFFGSAEPKVVVAAGAPGPTTVPTEGPLAGFRRALMDETLESMNEAVGAPADKPVFSGSVTGTKFSFRRTSGKWNPNASGEVMAELAYHAVGQAVADTPPEGIEFCEVNGEVTFKGIVEKWPEFMKEAEDRVKQDDINTKLKAARVQAYMRAVGRYGPNNVVGVYGRPKNVKRGPATGTTEWEFKAGSFLFDDSSGTCLSVKVNEIETRLEIENAGHAALRAALKRR